MALKSCKECGSKISTSAKVCVSCGKPQATTAKTLGLLALWIWVSLVGAFGALAIFVINADKTPPKTAASYEDVQEERAAAEKREADQLAAEKAEEARCASDLRCIAEKKTIDASFKCAPLIEQLAKNNFEWIDKWYEPKLSHFKWKNRTAQVITYFGDRIKYQNGFGAWVLSKYECDYNAALGVVLDVRASPGRLPLD
jgi:hypothetical protein